MIEDFCDLSHETTIKAFLVCKENVRPSVEKLTFSN